MLGSIRRQQPWTWAAIGKHPTAKDYIRIGGTTPLIEAVAEWAAKGYQHLRPAKDQPQTFHSWRFWLQGGKKGDLVVGLGRDSSDHIGRPFPLFLIGHGTIRRWEKNWTDLPLMLGKTWQSMESTVARRFENLNAMEEALSDISSPESGKEAALSGQARCETADAGGQQFKEQVINEGIGLVRLNQSCQGDPETSVLLCHRQLKTYCNEMPRGVFVGGTPQHTYLAAIAHPLGKADFTRLWTL